MAVDGVTSRNGSLTSHTMTDPAGPAVTNALHAALQHQKAGRLIEAELLYHTLLELEPASADPLYFLGEIARQRNDGKNAADFYQRAIAADPANPHYHLSLGALYRSQGELDKAARSYFSAVALNPAQAGLHDILVKEFSAVHGVVEPRERPRPGVLVESNEMAEGQRRLAEAVSTRLGVVLQLLGKFDAAIACFRDALSLQPESATAHFNLGLALMEQGKLEEAKECYRQAIACQADFVAAHCNLGNIFREQDKQDEALACYQAAHAIDPLFVDAIFNIGLIHSTSGQTALAKTWYRKALAADPGMVSAHINLAAILQDGGQLEEARWHRDQAYGKQCFFVTSTPGTKRTVLLLMDACNGNVPYLTLMPARQNSIVKWMIEYCAEGRVTELPHYDVVFNAIGDADVTDATARPVAEFARRSEKPVLNRPQAVAATARHLIPALLGSVEGVRIPPIWRVETKSGWHANPDFCFPMLARPLASHGGQGMVLVESREALSGLQFDNIGDVYLSAYEDYRSSDGYFRKYRMIFVDREPYPYHLAISKLWMVHYVTADMQDHAWKLEEERRFLADPASVLGERGMAAIESIGKRLDLDYGGVDFSILPDGRVLVFEANATMLVHPEKETGPLAFKNPFVQRIFDAFEALLARASGEA
jgi:tetratricopeptide (TPR) repeat protein